MIHFPITIIFKRISDFDSLKPLSYSFHQDIDVTVDEGKTIFASIQSKLSHSLAGAGTTRSMSNQFISLFYLTGSSSNPSSSFVKFAPAAGGDFDGLPGKSFKPGTSDTKVSVTAAVPDRTTKIKFVISGSFSRDATLGANTTYTEIQYDDAKLSVNEARIEVIPEGILIFASPNNFLKLTRDGLELSGAKIEAD